MLNWLFLLNDMLNYASQEYGKPYLVINDPVYEGAVKSDNDLIIRHSNCTIIGHFNGGDCCCPGTLSVNLDVGLMKHI